MWHCVHFSLFSRTGLGRGRAWLHLALMQKKIADYIKALLDHKDLLRWSKCIEFDSWVNILLIIFFFLPHFVNVSEFYDSGAMMLEEEGSVLGGLLVGLNVIDANLCIKGEDLDSQVSGKTSFSVFIISKQYVDLYLLHQGGSHWLFSLPKRSCKFWNAKRVSGCL